MPHPDIVASVALFRPCIEEFESFLSNFDEMDHPIFLYVVDNSPSFHNGIAERCEFRERTEYIHSPVNGGYGYGHNIALRRILADDDVEFALVLNPDVTFCRELPKKLAKFMRAVPEVGVAIPSVYNPDGSVQGVVEELPTPWSLMRSRILGRKSKALGNSAKSTFNKYDKVEVVSGCCMFIRLAALRNAGVFDERFFMYMEDVDLTRRITEGGFAAARFPAYGIRHHWSRDSKKSWRMLFIHLISAARYFMKWGIGRKTNMGRRNLSWDRR